MVVDSNPSVLAADFLQSKDVEMMVSQILSVKEVEMETKLGN